MADFLSRHMELVLVVLAVIIFLFRAGRIFWKAKKIDAKGIETDGEISRIEKIIDPDTASDSYVVYVRYHDTQENMTESPASLDQSVRYQEGEKVRIRYIPGEKELVRIIEG